MEKRCSVCGETKPIESFAFRSKREGAREARCRICRRNYYLENKERVSVVDAIYRASPEGQESRRRANARHKETYPKAVRARRLSNKAVERGKLPPVHTQTCECGRQADAYHHEDYTRPLAVTPMCYRCHVQIHKTYKPD